MTATASVAVRAIDERRMCFMLINLFNISRGGPSTPLRRSLAGTPKPRAARGFYLLHRTCELCIHAAIDVRHHVGTGAEAYAIARDRTGIGNADLERRFFSRAERPVIKRNVFRRHERSAAIEQRDHR